MVNYAKQMGERPMAGGPRAQPPPAAGGFGNLLAGTMRKAQETQALYPRGSAGVDLSSMFGQSRGSAGADPALQMSRPRPVLLDW
jgi:hypothetical protein